MQQFTLDTSGAVPMPSAHGGSVPFRWGGLSPFAQGYVEALFASAEDALRYPDTGPGIGGGHYGFSDLAPEALALILRKCGPEAQRLWGDTREGGRLFWSSFPLAPYLGDDGRVYLRET